MTQNKSAIKRTILLLAIVFVSANAFAQYYLSTIAGRMPLVANKYDTCGFYGDGGAATTALFNSPTGMCRDKAGNVYVGDYINGRVRKIHAATGIITTVAGGGSDTTNNIPATNAFFNLPMAVCIDKYGNLLIAAHGGLSFGRNAIYRLSMATGILTRIVGTGVQGYSGDGGPAISATLKIPSDVSVDTSNNIYIADAGNLIRKTDATTGIITTIAGVFGVTSNTGDGGPATSAHITLSGILVDVAGNIYVATGMLGNSIRKIDAATGIITRIAGTGTAGFSGDAGPATAAQLDRPERLAFDDSGNIYIADRGNARIRKIDISTNIISTIAGNNISIGAIGAGDNGPADSAQLGPQGMAFDTCGNLLFADLKSCRIRVLSKSLPYSSSCAISGVEHGYGMREPAAWQVYPNPATSVLIVNAPQAGATYSITDMLGRTVLKGVLNEDEQNINIGNLAPGSYFIAMYEGNARKHGSVFVKQ